MNITDPVFHNEDAARAHLEALRWPNGPACPHCGNADPDAIHRLEGKSHRPGLFQCNACREHFTVTVKSVMERSHVPLHKWVLGFHLMAASKKGMSAHQLHRMLGVTYKTAWFLAHRIREAMSGGAFSGPLGGENKVVETDESYVGGKAKNRAHKPPPKKHAVVSLVDREAGKVMSFHVANVTAKTLRPIIVKHASRKSFLMTDESTVYPKLGREFAGHGAVNHSAGEYARMGGFIHTNTVEGYFSLLKRGVIGTFHHISEAHLPRYLAEFDFRSNNRNVSDTERAAMAVRGAEGKRLLYRGPRSTANA
jgi:transposase-like protein